MVTQKPKLLKEKISVLCHNWDPILLDKDCRMFQFSTSSDIVKQSMVNFFEITKNLPSKTFYKLVTHFAIWRLLFGFDPVVTIAPLMHKRKQFSSDEMKQISKAFKGSHFVFVRKMKMRGVYTFMLINTQALTKVLHCYKKDLLMNIEDSINWIHKNVRNLGKYPIFFGLFSGFPKKSIELFSLFDGTGKQYPLLDEQWTNFRYGQATKEELLGIIKTCRVSTRTKRILLKVIRFWSDYMKTDSFKQERCSPTMDFLVMCKKDLLYARKRAEWLEVLLHVYIKILPQKWQCEVLDHITK